MLRYSIPLIPSTLFWWITNVSDRYLVTYLIGSDANGLYAASYKIPTIIVLVSNIFMDAWQMSAVSEYDKKGKEQFFSKVFGAFQSVLFAVGSGLIPVSYTHLDVYKRQLYALPQGRTPGTCDPSDQLLPDQ